MVKITPLYFTCKPCFSPQSPPIYKAWQDQLFRPFKRRDDNISWTSALCITIPSALCITNPPSPIRQLTRHGKINFVDLAGSEMTKKTKSEGKTLEEANNINKSLMVTLTSSAVDERYWRLLDLHSMSKRYPSVAGISTGYSWLRFVKFWAKSLGWVLGNCI